MEGRTFPLLMETDQQRCYDDGGAPLDCAETGQDGALAKLPAAAASRFQDHGDTVADTLTGAVWSRDANPAGFPLTWEEARSYAADMARHKAYGYDNWQLPPRRVLFSLLSHQNTGPALPAGHPFSNVFQG